MSIKKSEAPSAPSPEVLSDAEVQRLTDIEKSKIRATIIGNLAGKTLSISGVAAERLRTARDTGTEFGFKASGTNEGPLSIQFTSEPGNSGELYARPDLEGHEIQGAENLRSTERNQDDFLRRQFETIEQQRIASQRTGKPTYDLWHRPVDIFSLPEVKILIKIEIQKVNNTQVQEALLKEFKI